MQKAACRFVVLFLCFTGYLLVFPELSFSSQSNKIAVIISNKIRPYIDILEGINDGINKDAHEITPYFLPDLNETNNEKNNEKIVSQISKVPYNLFVAIGPEAAKFVWDLNEKSDMPKIYTAVLNPDKILGENIEACGLSLRIPVETQIQEISNSFPGLKKIGLIFDARFNDWFYEKAFTAAKNHGISIIPLRIKSKNQIPTVIKNNWDNIDCIWMIPDRTIISEKIIQYIIKQALYNKTGVIGYNSFFIRSGAFFSFEFDYKKLGGQTAKKIELYFKGEGCHSEPPLFHKIVNEKIARKIGIQIKE